MKPSIPKGTRDFSPVEMVQRNYIFETIRKVFQLYGYAPIETPSMENLSTLMGKYGEEGDKLIFKIIESGEFALPFQGAMIKKIDKLIIADKKNKKLLEYGDHFADILSSLDITGIKDASLEHLLITSLKHPKELDMDERPDYWYNFKKIYVDFLLSKQPHDSLKRSYIENYYLLEVKSERKISIKKDFENFIEKSTKLSSLNNLFDFIEKEVTSEALLRSEITKKALRYDLTVPFARYVVQHQNEITFPFKRYQIQPVWRADRPQKGRYREFYQCDADVIGSTSLLNEVELVQMIDAVFTQLDVAVTIKINNRKILSGIAEVIGEKDKIVDITVAIDKLDKIGLDAVNQELHDRGVANSAIAKLQPLINFKGDFEQKRSILKHFLSSSEIGKKGIEEIEYIFNRINSVEGDNGNVSPFNKSKLELDITLARGLNYYTGAIFEIQTDEGSLRSSICGGGRYDDLTGIFGLPNVSGVGISFGIDRIFDVLTECKKFDKIDYTKSTTKLLFAHFGEQEQLYCLPLLNKVRAAGINAEVYPDITKKIVKQFEYADKKKIPFVVVVGGDEMKTGELTLKNMISGEQKKTSITELVNQLKSN